MGSNNLFQFMQQGFRVAVGATATFLETLQDTQKRETTLEQFRTELEQKSKEWADKGEETEQEARKMVDEWFNRQKGTKTASNNRDTSPSSAVATTTTEKNVEVEIQELTEQIMSLRDEIEQEKKADHK